MDKKKAVKATKTRLEELEAQHQKIVREIDQLQQARLRTEGAILMLRELDGNGPKEPKEESKK